MKITCLFILIFIYSFPFKGLGQTQKDSAKFTIGASFGPAIPFLDFGNPKNEPYGTTIGYAGIGMHYDGIVNYQFSRNIGIMISIGGNVNPYTYEPPNPLFYYTKGNYFVAEYLGGLSSHIFLSKSFFFNISALIGEVTFNSPTHELYYNGQYAGSNYSMPFANGFAWNLNIGINKILSKHWDIKLDISYTDSEIQYLYYRINNMSLGLVTPSIEVGFMF